MSVFIQNKLTALQHLTADFSLNHWLIKEYFVAGKASEA
jgi:hypothetical protein